jgi:hypothetical protein
VKPVRAVVRPLAEDCLSAEDSGCRSTRCGIRLDLGDELSRSFLSALG